MKYTLLSGALALGLLGAAGAQSSVADDKPPVVKDDEVPKKKDEKAKTVSLYYLEASGKG